MFKQNNEFVKNEGYKVLNVKYDENSGVVRHLFIKQFTLKYHKNENDDKPENKTLSIISVPPFVNEQHIRYLFDNCGKIIRIFFQEKPSLSSVSNIYNKIQCLNGEEQKITSVMDLIKHKNEINCYKVCYVVFNKTSGLSNALKMAETEKIYFFRPTIEKSDHSNNSCWYTGVKLWQKQYNDSIINEKEMKNIAEAFIEQHSKRVEEMEKMELDQAEIFAEPDNQGWITVNRKLRRNREALQNDRYNDEKIEEKYKKRELKRKNKEKEYEKYIENLTKDAMKVKKKKKVINF